MKKASLFSDVRDLIGAVLLTTLAVLIASSGTAKADTIAINCPVAQAKREITDGLPGGWWNTPLVSNLSATEVAVIGGKSALICRYGQSGSVQRYAPVGATCSASGTGFVCETAVIIIPPPVLPAYSDTIVIPHLGGADLDGGGSAPDLKVVVTNPGFIGVISPANGARFASARSSAKGKAGCTGASFKNKPVPAAVISPDNFVCYKTSDGRIGEFEIMALPEGGAGSVKISFTTWN